MYLHSGLGSSERRASALRAARVDTIRPAAARLDRFAFKSAALTDAHHAEIDRVAQRIASSWTEGVPIRTVKVVGHTDPVGKPDANQALGLRRALAVRKALQRAMEKQQRHLSFKVLVLASSKGEREPVDPTGTPDGDAKNRRVEIFLSTKALAPIRKKTPPPVRPPSEPSDFKIPVILPDIRPQLPPDTEPGCDYSAYQAEVDRIRNAAYGSLWSCAYGYLKDEGAAAAFALGALAAAPSGVLTIPAIVGLIAAAGLTTAAKIEIARCAYGILTRMRAEMKDAKKKFHCL